jgi:hypothetical protein
MEGGFSYSMTIPGHHPMLSDSATTNKQAAQRIFSLLRRVFDMFDYYQ